MLVLSRKVGEQIVIGDNITIVVNRISGKRVSLGIDAPEDVKIIRGELDRYVREFDGPDEEVARPPSLAPTSFDLDSGGSCPPSPRLAR